MRSIALVILYLVSAFVWAKPSCEFRFLGEISKGAYHDQKIYSLENELMDAIIDEGVEVYNKHFNCHDGQVFVFREHWPYRNGEDLGFRVQFSYDKKNRFWLEGIKPSDTNEEREYFIRLAKCLDLDWTTFHIRRPIDGSYTVAIAPHVLVKLQEKHRMDYEQVQQAFNNRTSDPARTSKRNSVQEFVSQLDDGTPVRVITAYDYHQDAWSLVSMFHRK